MSNKYENNCSYIILKLFVELINKINIFFFLNLSLIIYRSRLFLHCHYVSLIILKEMSFHMGKRPGTFAQCKKFIFLKENEARE